MECVVQGIIETQVRAISATHSIGTKALVFFVLREIYFTNALCECCYAPALLSFMHISYLSVYIYIFLPFSICYDGNIYK